MNNVPPPLFAPASQNAQDDFDFNDIFAEYFSNEFDTDPMNAYTGGMAHYNGSTPAVMMGGPMGQHQQGQQPLPLPTGGIRTAFHNNSSTPVTSSVAIGGGVAGSLAPPPKKMKTEDNYYPQMQMQMQPQQQQQQMNSQQPQQHMMMMQQPQQEQQFQQDPNQQMQQQQSFQQLQMQQQPQQQNMQMNMGENGSSLSGQQFMMMQQPQMQQMQQQNQMQQMQQQNQMQQQVGLPVGVGIRLGGGMAGDMGGIGSMGGGMMQQPQGGTAAMGGGGMGAMVGSAAGMAGMQPNVAAAGMAAQQQLQQFMWAQQAAAAAAGIPTHFESGMGGDGHVAERRQRNREHAKRSRVRKKFMLESLQEEVFQLQRENQTLRMMVQEHIPEHAMQIIADCCTGNPLFDDIDLHMKDGSDDGQDDDATGTGSTKPKPDGLVKSDFTLMHSLAMGQQCFVLSDPKLPDNPIVFASPGFYKLTGYTSKEVLGRNCRFLQGPGTAKRALDVIRKAIETGSDATVCLLNYKSDGTPFWNQFFLASLRDSDNNIVNYVGVMTQVEPDAGANALEERVNAVLPLQPKDDKDDGDDSD